MRGTLLIMATLVAGLIAASGLMSSDAEPASAAPKTERWTFPIRNVVDVPREGVAESMFGFLIHVDEAGVVRRIDGAWKVRGALPAYRAKPDFGRTYRWELLDAAGRVLDTGLHFDLTAAYVPQLDGGCEKKVIGAHELMIRTTHSDAAVSVAFSVERHHTDVEEEG